MNCQTLSPYLRAEIKFVCGRQALEAVQEHLYQKSLGYFDPNADWQITDILELSEVCDRLKKLAASFKMETSLKMEAMRIAKIIEDDFQDVYDVAMERTTGHYRVA